MSPRTAGAALARALPLVAFLFSPACGDDEDEAAAPRRPPTLRIAELKAGDGQVWLRERDSGVVLGPVHPSCDPNRSLGVRVEVEEFDLRPPKACGGSPRCGNLWLEATGPAGSVTAEAASPWVGAPLGASFQPGQYRLRVELRSNKNPVTVGGSVLSDEVSIVIEAPTGCEPSDAGADAELDAGPDAPLDAPETDTAADAPLDAATDAPSADSSEDAGSDAPDAADDSAADTANDTSGD